MTLSCMLNTFKKCEEGFNFVKVCQKICCNINHFYSFFSYLLVMCHDQYGYKMNDIHVFKFKVVKVIVHQNMINSYLLMFMNQNIGYN
jgi:hypothetical protein